MLKKPGDGNLKNIDNLVKARMDVPTLTYKKKVGVGGLTSDLDIPNKGYVDYNINNIKTTHKKDVKDLSEQVSATNTRIDKKIFEEDTKIEKLADVHTRDVSGLRKELTDKHPLSKNLKDIDETIHV